MYKPQATFEEKLNKKCDEFPIHLNEQIKLCFCYLLLKVSHIHHLLPKRLMSYIGIKHHTSYNLDSKVSYDIEKVLWRLQYRE